MDDIRVRVWRVGRSSESQYLLVLRGDGGAILPMTIGPCEAIAIWSALRHNDEEDEIFQGPGTHDLLCALIERFGGRLTKVVIDDLWNQVYYAKLHVALNGSALTIDARPSDSVAIALRLKAPLFVAPAVLEAAGELEAEGSSHPEATDPPSEPDLGGL